jgi:DNA polymerase III subunit gamma/tau
MRPHETRPLVEKHQPVRFGDVVGQPEAVRYLSSLILMGTRGRNLFFFGPIGTGKTTLVEIFAKGLNCDHPDQSGTACNACDGCTKFPEYFAEYNVAELGGGLEEVSIWLDAKYREPADGRVRILFLDEAHRLSRPAQDSLLKRAQPQGKRIIFCLATSEPQEIKWALRSRFQDVRFRPLSVAEAVSLLEDIARKERMSYDREAFYLLTAIKPLQPRDLISALEQLSVETHISLDLAERSFGLDFRHLISAYCAALADGNQCAQAVTLAKWDESTVAKIKWIQRFLTETYHNNIIGRDTVIDPLTHASDVDRADVVRRFCHRLNVNSPSALASFFEDILGFWAHQSPDEDNADLRLGLFEALVNRGLTTRPDVLRNDLAYSTPPVTKILTHLESDGGVRDFEWSARRGDSNFLEASDAAELVNRLSCLAQQHGTLVNTAMTIVPRPETLNVEQLAIDAIFAFTKGLSTAFDRPQSAFASVTLFEREAYVAGRIVAHIPDLETQPDFSAELRVWCENWEATTGDTVDVQHGRSENSVKWHWDQIISLCAGAQDVFAVDRAEDDFRKRIGIARKNWKQLGPTACAPVIYSGRLSRSALEAACAYGVQFEPAIEPRGGGRLIRDGWELNAYRLRMKELQKRHSQIAELSVRFADDPARLEAERSRLQEIWSGLSIKYDRTEYP